MHYNHLFGTASIFNDWSYQAWEYTATAFQALGAATLTGTALGSPGELQLNGTEYDACPNILLGNFVPNGYWAYGEQSHTQVTLASCNQDLRQAYTPTITKLTWTFWNQDESARTGTHWCADSWYETNFPLAGQPLVPVVVLFAGHGGGVLPDRDHGGYAVCAGLARRPAPTSA